MKRQTEHTDLNKDRKGRSDIFNIFPRFDWYLVEITLDSGISELTLKQSWEHYYYGHMDGYLYTLWGKKPNTVPTIVSEIHEHRLWWTYLKITWEGQSGDIDSFICKLRKLIEAINEILDIPRELFHFIGKVFDFDIRSLINNRPRNACERFYSMSWLLTNVSQGLLRGSCNLVREEVRSIFSIEE